MPDTPIQISYSLEEVLTRIERKIDDRFQETNQKLDVLQKDMTEIRVGQAKLEAELKGDIKALDEKLSGQINTLDEKVTGFGKRLENQEFVNRGILVALVVAILGSAAKLLGWVGNP